MVIETISKIQKNPEISGEMVRLVKNGLKSMAMIKVFKK